MMDPETSLTLLSMLEERACTRFPHQTATVHSLFAKTAELYRLQDAPPNNAAALPLFREVGAEWLQSLTPEEKTWPWYCTGSGFIRLSICATATGSGFFRRRFPSSMTGCPVMIDSGKR